MRVAIYRIHYGFCFLHKSLPKVLEWADEVIIAHSRNAWYTEKSIKYLGREVEIAHPENVEWFLDKLSKIKKIKVVNREFTSPRNQWGQLINEFSTDYVLAIEPDMEFISSIAAFEPPQAAVAIGTCNQIEYWKTEHYRIPQRKRVGPVVFRSPKNIATHFDNVPLSGSSFMALSIPTKNWGFCAPSDVMRYKHLLALGFSSRIGDSIPNERWYEDKWLNWTPDLTDLEIAKGHEHLITQAVRL